MPRPPEYEGQRFRIACLTLPDGTCPVGTFLDALDESERRKLDVLFERLGDSGKISNVEKFKKLEGSNGLFEFKSHQIRLICFFTRDKQVILALAVRKKKDKHTRSDIERAEALKADYEATNG